MSRILCSAFVASLVAVSLGCDKPPSPPKTEDGKVVETVAVSQNDPAEIKAVTDYQAAKVYYEFRLEVLRNYYERVGNVDKWRWARRELENLLNAQAFEWTGADDVLPPEGESLTGADERLLVEQVVSARREYLDALDELIAHYEDSGDEFKLALARNIKHRFDPVRTYMYFLEAEIPPADLTPTEVIPAAEELFSEAHALYREGQILPAVTDYDKERRALVKFLELVRQYPNSTRIAEAAFYIGEIYKEYFNENVRAVHWYQRAWQWDPNIDKPAHYQAAVVWDHRLHNKSKAVEQYRAAIDANQGDTRYARNRLEQLTR
ncbi:MAG: tetratricopeptide repeat protein [Phycisphaerae bacterium]